MLANTTFAKKSGEMGTAMFSRPGKFTKYSYLCFQNSPEEEASPVQTLKAKS